MSKVDAMRALKMARLEEQRKAMGAPPAVTPRPVVAAAPPRAAVTAPVSAPNGVCGHRNMSGRSCTRDSGHSEKSHRYS